MSQISRATRLIVMGFSMPPTDLHFKYLLAAGLRENISLREILFVNPSKEVIEQRAIELFGDLQRRPTVRIAQIQAVNFIGQGELSGAMASVGRTMHGSIQQVYHHF